MNTILKHFRRAKKKQKTFKALAVIHFQQGQKKKRKEHFGLHKLKNNSMFASQHLKNAKLKN